MKMKFFDRPFWKGFKSIFNIFGGTEYNYYYSDIKINNLGAADKKAVEQDFLLLQKDMDKVFEDMEELFKAVEKKNENENENENN